MPPLQKQQQARTHRMSPTCQRKIPICVWVVLHSSQQCEVQRALNGGARRVCQVQTSPLYLNNWHPLPLGHLDCSVANNRHTLTHEIPPNTNISFVNQH